MELKKLKFNNGRKNEPVFSVGMKLVISSLRKNGLFGWVESNWHCVSDTTRRHIVFLQKSNYQSPNFSYFQYKYTIFLYYCKK